MGDGTAFLDHWFSFAVPYLRFLLLILLFPSCRVCSALVLSFDRFLVGMVFGSGSEEGSGVLFGVLFGFGSVVLARY